MQTTQHTVIEPRAIPGPRIWPVLGNLGVLRGLLPFLEQQRALHGDVFRIRTAGFGGLVIADPELLAHVLLTKRHNYVKGPVYDQPRKILGDGLVTLEGEAWRARRSLAQPAFHRQSLERLTQIMVDSGAAYFAQLTQRLAGPLDVHREMTQLTMDVVVNALFGKGIQEGTSVSYRTISEALEVVSNGVNGVPLPSWLPTPHNFKFRRTVRELNRNVHEIIQAGRARGAGEGTLLSMLLDARDERGEALSDQAVRDEVMTLFLAGHETTALTLTWLMVLLSDRPDVLRKMNDEVHQVLRGRDPGFTDVPKLVYLRQVIDETLRLRPPAAMIARNALADDDLAGFPVHAGEVVIPYIWGAHRHAAHWPDPERFDPERFAAAQQKGRHVGSYLPFSIGPRICIGNTFSLIETTILVAQLLLRFELTIHPCPEVKPVAVGTVRTSRPVWMQLRPRVHQM